jgi:NAD(P)-dependent dehydrogenase (short-subunit alcohol dehydrogenase family)
VTRAAGLALTKVLAGEGAPHGILVNALLVGRVVSDQTGKDVPLGRMGEAREFAAVATFLASDAASYVTGVGIPVDGGLSPGI